MVIPSNYTDLIRSLSCPAIIDFAANLNMPTPYIEPPIASIGGSFFEEIINTVYTLSKPALVLTLHE